MNIQLECLGSCRSFLASFKIRTAASAVILVMTYPAGATTTPAKPSIVPAAGTYTTGQTVTITESTSGATLYYTTDGSAPSSSSPVYSGKIVLPTAALTETIRAIAILSGVSGPTATNAYVIAPVLPAPTFSPAQGSFTSAQNVTIKSATAGSTIYYTTDGTTPTTSSSVYTAPVPAPMGRTIITAMVGGVSGYTNSSLKQTYTVVPTTPYISPASGTYTSAKTVTITDSSPGTTIYYTTDGSTPTLSSPVYSAPLSLPNSPMSETVRALASVGAVYGSVASASYTIMPTIPSPAASHPSGNYTAPITVTLSDTIPGTTIYYTLDNSSPTTSSAIYSAPFSFSQNASLKTMAVKAGYTTSSVIHYTYSFLVPNPVISPGTGTFTTKQTVTISESLGSAVVNYTTDGSTPTTSSPVYTGPFSFAQTGVQVVKALATASGYQPSSVSQVTLTLNLPSGVIANTVILTTPNIPIATNFLGFAHEWGNAQAMMGMASAGVNPIYRTLVNNLTANMHGPMMIRIGGTSTDSSGMASPSTVQPFLELNQALNATFILGVNLGSNNLSLAEEQATTFISSLPSSALAALEIGNEPDGYAANGTRPSTYGYSDFLPQFQQWAQGAAGPSTPAPVIAGPVLGTGNWIQNAQPDITGGALQAGLVTQHKYVACYNANSPLPTNILLQPSSSTGSLYLLQPYAAAAHQAGSKFRMAEINSVCSGGQVGVSNTFSSALWAIDTMFEYVNAGIDGVNWNTSYNGGPYDLFQFNTWYLNGTNNYSLTAVRPEYYGLLFFSEAAGNTAQLLPASTLTNANIKVWVTTDSAHNAHLVIINKEISTSGTVRIALRGYTKGSVVRLIASSYQATSGVTIGGQGFDTSVDGTIQGTHTTETTSPDSSGNWNITVNAMSAVLVNLQP